MYRKHGRACASTSLPNGTMLIDRNGESSAAVKHPAISSKRRAFVSSSDSLSSRAVCRVHLLLHFFPEGLRSVFNLIPPLSEATLALDTVVALLLQSYPSEWLSFFPAPARTPNRQAREGGCGVDPSFGGRRQGFAGRAVKTAFLGTLHKGSVASPPS